MGKGMHVVFGAAGALGAAIVQNLARQNQAVRAVVRDVGRARKVLPSSAEIVVADASKPDSIKTAFNNVSVIYHCVNVPYNEWTEVMPLVTNNILAGAIEKHSNFAVLSCEAVERGDEALVVVMAEFAGDPDLQNLPIVFRIQTG